MLDALHSYAAATRFLNGVLSTEYTRTGNSDSLYFISVNAELDGTEPHITSHDPAYWPADWIAALDSTEMVSAVEAYAALLRFIDEFAARGCDDVFRAAVAPLHLVENGHPRDPVLARAWEAVWEQAARADVDAAVLMTRSPFIESRWRSGRGWIT